MKTYRSVIFGHIQSSVHLNHSCMRFNFAILDCDACRSRYNVNHRRWHNCKGRLSLQLWFYLLRFVKQANLEISSLLCDSTLYDVLFSQPYAHTWLTRKLLVCLSLCGLVDIKAAFSTQFSSLSFSSSRCLTPLQVLTTHSGKLLHL